MGRTVPSFRLALEQEFDRWSRMKKSLSKSDRKVFDEMLTLTRIYSSAASGAVRTSVFEGLMMSSLFHNFKRLRRAGEELEEISEVMRWKWRYDPLR